MNSPNRHEAREARKAILKARLSVSDVIVALGLDSDLGPVCPAPACGAVGTVHETANSQGWRCAACDASGDIFTLAMEAKDLAFPGAVKWLEENALPARRDRKTRDLFGGGT